MINFKKIKNNTKITVPEHLKFYIDGLYLTFLRYDESKKIVYFVHPNNNKEETFFEASELKECKLYK